MTNTAALEAVCLGANFCIGLLCLGMGLIYFLTMHRLTVLESKIKSLTKRDTGAD
ncbi:MAG: hypothetical protein WC102_04810 [Saccharofermentanales bacterium]